MNARLVSRRGFLAFGAAAVGSILAGWQIQPVQAGKLNILYSGNPRNQKPPLIGDKGFISDYQFGDVIAPYEGRIVGGPFCREFDQYVEGVRDNYTYVVGIWGSGSAIIGATDFKMCNEDHFGFYREEVALSSSGTAFSFYWPGLKKLSDGTYNGYGFEVIVLQGQGERCIVKHIDLIRLGPGNLT